MGEIIAGRLMITQHKSITGGEEAVNVFNVDFGTAALTLTLANDIADAVWNAWNDNLRIKEYEGNVVDRIQVKDMRVPNGGAFDFAYTTFGGNSNQPLPNGVSAVITWRTGSTGKSFRGRSYVGGFTEADSAGNSPVTSLSTALSAYADDLETNLVAVSNGMQVASELLEVLTPITGHQVRQAWHSQRRRNLRG